MKKSILGIVFISFLVTGCSPIFYTPNTQNVPMISKKGDNKIVVAGNTNQVELQGAYGLSDAFAIQANAGLFIPRNLDNGDGRVGRSQKSRHRVHQTLHIEAGRHVPPCLCKSG